MFLLRVSIEVECHSRLRVPQAILHSLDVNTVGDEQGRVSVAQFMELEATVVLEPSRLLVHACIALAILVDGKAVFVVSLLGKHIPLRIHILAKVMLDAEVLEPLIESARLTRCARGTDFDTMELDERLALLNNLIENLLKYMIVFAVFAILLGGDLLLD